MSANEAVNSSALNARMSGRTMPRRYARESPETRDAQPVIKSDNRCFSGSRLRTAMGKVAPPTKVTVLSR
jgi:hypothetical protein